MTLTSIFSQENNVKNKEINSNSGIILKIELANPKIFHQNDEIYINVKIFNSSKVDKACLIADDKRFSFDFQMVTMQNRQVEHNREYIISFHRVQPVFNTNIRLRANEGYVYEARLNDYFDLNKTGQFFVKCLYHPELKLNNSEENAISSNQLSINIRPTGIKEETSEEKKVETPAPLFMY